MKGLKKIALASAIAAVAAGAQAELKALDDSTMSEMTGQAGLTIDLQTKWTIGEFAYQDAGLIVLKDLSLGGNSNEVGNAFHNNTTGLLDNIRMEIDVAGSQAAIGGDAWLKYGFSNVKNLAAVHLAAGNKDAGMIALAKGSAAVDPGNSMNGTSIDTTTGLAVDDEKFYGDGDLKIHFTFTDAWQKGGGFAAYGVGKGSDGGAGTASLATLTYAAARNIATKAVDFEFNIGQIALAASAYATDGRLGGVNNIEKTNHTTGLDTTADTTTLISDLSIKGYLGPADIHIENNGNGFGADGSGLGGAPGTGNADSKIHWDSFFRVTDLDVYIDIAGVQIKDLSIHNTRGDQSSLNGTSSFGFAHSMRDIYAVKDTVLKIGSAALLNGGQNKANFVDGIAINTKFKGDIDIGHLSFGDTGTSIGKIFITDRTATTNWTISAH